MAVTRRSTNALIASTLALLLLAGLPPACDAQGRLRRTLVGALSGLGLCQPEWRLFAPNVHKTNSYLVAEVLLASGEARHWTSPDFSERSLREKFVQGQLPKLYDNLRLDRHHAAWRPLAEWIAREVAPNEAVRSVRLERRYYEIPPPSAEHWSTRPPARSEYAAHVFYVRRF